MLIQTLRLRRGWSQEQLAAVSGLSVRTIQRVETGHSASLETLKCLAAVFEIDLADLREPPMTDIQTMTSTAAAAEEALAFARIREIKRFYLSLIQYAVVIATCAAINLTVGGYLWFGWVALFWGLALIFKGLRVYDKIPFLSASWERRMVERDLGRSL